MDLNTIGLIAAACALICVILWLKSKGFITADGKIDLSRKPERPEEPPKEDP